MIPDATDIQDDMRGKRFDELAGEMCDHARSRSRWLRNREAIRAFASALVFVLLLAGANADEWFLLPEPKFMGHGVTFPIEGAKATVLVPAKMGEQGVEFVTVTGWTSASLNEEGVRKATRACASEWFRHVKPEYVRNRKKVIEYALIQSDKLPVAATVFAPEFWKEFADVFGPKMIVVIPNRQTVFVFPGVAVDYAEYAPLIFQAWRGPSAKVSLEVFALSERGFRAVGRLEEP